MNLLSTRDNSCRIYIPILREKLYKANHERVYTKVYLRIHFIVEYTSLKS